jgi:hypothetical protein
MLTVVCPFSTEAKDSERSRVAPKLSVYVRTLVQIWRYRRLVQCAPKTPDRLRSGKSSKTNFTLSLQARIIIPLIHKLVFKIAGAWISLSSAILVSAYKRWNLDTELSLELLGTSLVGNYPLSLYYKRGYNIPQCFYSYYRVLKTICLIEGYKSIIPCCAAAARNVAWRCKWVILGHELTENNVRK